MKYRQMSNCPMCSAFMVGNVCVNCGYRKAVSQH